MKIYTVRRVSVGIVKLFRREDQDPENKEQEITPERSLSLRLHSPDGFGFGYTGSGPAQLALAILLDVFKGDVPLVLDNYQAFKVDKVSSWKLQEAEITEREIYRWLASSGRRVEEKGV